MQIFLTLFYATTNFIGVDDKNYTGSRQIL